MSSPRRIVIVGNGMAGARLVERLRAADPYGERLAVTVVGSEAHPAYNRVLLSEVLAGRMDVESLWLQEPGWAAEHGVALRLGCTVTTIDRARRVIAVEEHGETEEIGYDELILATGAQPWLPPVDGLSEEDGRPAPNVTTLRTLEECEHLQTAIPKGAPVVVLGGGLLGCEAARGLAGRGHPVTVVHPLPQLMERQLDAGAAMVLRKALSDYGIEFRLGKFATHYVPGDGVKLEDGYVVPAEIVVVCAGVRPDTALAEAAGLSVEGGILVDDSLRTNDPRIRAIGDCARHDGVGGGMVDIAWNQADVLADLLTGEDAAARYRGSALVTRLKADGVDLTAVGEPLVDVFESDAEVVQVADPKRGRYGKLVLRGEKIVGAIAIGLPDAAATITQLFDRGLDAPSDRLSLLLGRAAAPAGAGDSIDSMSDDTVICRCNSVSKGALCRAFDDGATDAAQLSDVTRAGTGCGGCRDKLTMIADALSAQRQKESIDE